MASLLLLSLIAYAMVAIIILILYFTTRIKTFIGLFFLYFSLAMMLTMFLGASIYIYSPSNTTLAIAFAINMALMIFLLTYFFAIAENISERSLTNNPINIYGISVLLVANEVLMSTTFGLAQFGPKYFSSAYGAFYYTINSYWFFYPMMAEMLGFYLIHYVKGQQFQQLLPLVGVTAFPPTAFNVQDWFPFALVLTLGASAYGMFLNRKRERLWWFYIYLSLIFTSLLLLVNAIPYDINVIIAMVMYYATILFQTFEKVTRGGK